MSRFAIRGLLEDITYWPPHVSGQTNDFGHPIFQAPILIKGRWENKVQQVRKPTGEEVVSMAEVFVDREVEISGYLAQGDHTTSSDPEEVATAREVQTTLTTPDFRNLDHERRAFL